MGIGIDCGTYNIIRAKRGDNDSIDCLREVNAFIEIPLENRFTFNMLKTAKVPLIERDKVAYAVGEKAVSIAYSFGNLELKRPMADGCVNPREKASFEVLNRMLHSLVGEVEKDGEVLCYSVPADALNDETDVAYHQEVLKQIFSAYSVNDKRVVPHPINEALALVYAELQDKLLTGIGISFGSGMCNVCYAVSSVPILQFSLVGCGDWIDSHAAKALGESPTFINKEKMKVDLSQPPKTDIERAIQTQYRILIRRTVKGIKEGLEAAGNRARSDNPVDIVIAGGTSSPNGFDNLIREAIDEVGGFPIEIGNIKRPKDHLYAVARGCLIAAEAAEV